MAVHYIANAAHSILCHVSYSLLMFHKFLLSSCSALLAKDAQGHDVLVHYARYPRNPAFVGQFNLCTTIFLDRPQAWAVQQSVQR
jgi:hypothetical protein